MVLASVCCWAMTVVDSSLQCLYMLLSQRGLVDRHCLTSACVRFLYQRGVRCWTPRAFFPQGFARGCCLGLTLAPDSFASSLSSGGRLSTICGPAYAAACCSGLAKSALRSLRSARRMFACLSCLPELRLHCHRSCRKSCKEPVRGIDSSAPMH